MKRIILPFLFIGLFLPSAVAQKGKPSRTDTTSVNAAQKDAKVFIPSPELGFRFYPNDSLRYKKIPRYRLPKMQPDSLQQQLLAERQSPIDNMPIAGSPGYYTRMPIYKPDTTIDFKLKILKLNGRKVPYSPIK
jgi:hypothetical protein